MGWSLRTESHRRAIPCSKLKPQERHNHALKDASREALEVSVSTFDNIRSSSSTSTPLRRTVSKSRLLTISASGSCTVKDHPRLGLPRESRTSVHRMSMKGLYNPFPSMGKYKGTAEDKILECILWLKKGGNHKYVKASKDVLARYNDAFLYAELPYSIKLRAAIRGDVLRPLLIWLEFMTALISVIVYVHSTYESSVHEYFPIIETVCGAFFLVDYFVNLYSAPVRLYFIFSATGILDLISVLPIACVWRGERNFGFEILLFLRALRLLPILTSIGLTGATIGQQIVRLVMYAFGVVFIAAGLMQWVEYKATSAEYKEANGCSPKGCMSFFEAFYFMIVTISTVGYGDITPKSDWGRVIGTLAIVAALVILPVQVNNLLQLASRRPYGGYFAVNKVVGSRFVIVSGNLTFRTVQDFLSEFYHPNHDQALFVDIVRAVNILTEEFLLLAYSHKRLGSGMAAFPLRVLLNALRFSQYQMGMHFMTMWILVINALIPGTNLIRFELKTLLTLYKHRVEFIQGNPLKDSDLDRVGAKIASALFLLADQNVQDPDAEDATQILRTLAVHRHSGADVRVIVELLKPEKKTNAIWDDTDQGIEICPEVIRFKLLSKSCHVQGVSTFVVNLFRQGLVVSKPEKGNWLRQYYHGLKQEVFPVLLPHVFCKEELLFEEAAELIYHRHGVLLFALDVVSDLAYGREVLLFPKGHVLGATDVGIVIAKSLQATERVSKFGLSKKEWCHMNFPCLHWEEHAGMTDLESVMDMKSRRCLSGTEETQSSSNYTIVIPGGTEMEMIRRASSPTEGLLERMSNLQTRFLVDASFFPAADTMEADAEQEIDRDQHPQHVRTLEEAIDVAMSWPPLYTEHKPDPPILDRRSEEILKNLAKRTLSVVKFKAPHILMCMQGSWPVNLFYFFSHSRKHSPTLIPIVLLHSSKPTVGDWGCVGMFEEVYFVQGSPMYELDLIRAGVLQAAKVVILTSNSYVGEHGEAANDRDQMTVSPSTSTKDLNNIIVAATVERLLKPVGQRIIVELQQESAFQYLRPKLFVDERQFFSEIYRRNRMGTFQFAPPFVEGKVFCPQTLAFLMYASFFNRSTVSIVEQFISGGRATQDGSDDLRTRILDQIEVPQPFASKTFGELFTGLLRRDGLLALGLYRPLGAHGSIVPYVFTNPSPHETLELKDLVYVLR